MDDAADDLVCALERAAELEHAVLLQYLFAAASLKRHGDEGVGELELERIRGWERTLLLIAREEMAHLAAVSNHRIAVGGRPRLVRPGLPGGRLGAAGEEALVLERFGRRSLARFVGLEREESSAPGATAGHYAAIKREIGRRDAAGRQVVRERPLDPVDGWGISGGARFGPVTDARAAVALIEAIVGQGTGCRGGEADSHLRRLLVVEDELEAADFDPARRVATNPTVSGPGTRIDDQFTAAVAVAFAAAYQAMALLLELYYVLVQTGARAYTARRLAQGLMSGVVRPLGEVLSSLPVGVAAPGWSAGPTFAWDEGIALTEDHARSWALLGEMLTGAAVSLRRLGRTWSRPRLTFIAGNLELAGQLADRSGAG
jgi:hypothetical protein